MDNLSGVALLRTLRATHRPTETLPFSTAEPAGAGPAAATARSLARRLGLVLHDLGLDGVLPSGWVSADGAALVFDALDVPAADRLVRHLEDLAALLADTAAAEAADRRRAGAGQAALFGAQP